MPHQPDEGLKNRFKILYWAWWPSIESLIRDTVSSASAAGSLLQQMALYQMNTGGKRVRAILPLLVAEALGHDLGKVVAFGAACETLHNASLVHDDLQDGDRVRRGHPTVWRRFGTAQAINLGDALIACAFLLVQRLDTSPVMRERVTRRMLLEMLRTTDGQVRDLEPKARQQSTVSEYLRIVESKTARLFALPISGAATLCGADEGVEQALSEAAGHVGVLFQLQDDIVDTLGHSGGVQGQDILNGHRNLLVVHCLETADPLDAARFQRVLDKPRTGTTAEDVALAQALIEQNGSLDFAVAEIHRRRSAALAVAALQQFPVLVEMLDSACKLFLRGIKPILEHRRVSAVGQRL
jgi:geranylgeranyl diphosphate synthase, type I